MEDLDYLGFVVTCTVFLCKECVCQLSSEVHCVYTFVSLEPSSGPYMHFWSPALACTHPALSIILTTVSTQRINIGERCVNSINHFLELMAKEVKNRLGILCSERMMLDDQLAAAKGSVYYMQV